MSMLVCGAMVLRAEENKKDTKPITVVGEVSVAQEDDDGNAVQAAIWSDDGRYYMVATDAKGKELLKLVDKKVSVTGTVVTKEDEDLVITVSSYKVLPEEKPAANDAADEEGVDLE